MGAAVHFRDEAGRRFRDVLGVVRAQLREPCT
jgi:hypothetical protein